MPFEKSVLKKTAATVFFFLLFYAATGFFGVPLLLKTYLPEQISASIDRPVTIEKASFNPFLLSVDIHGLDIREKNNEPFFNLAHFHAGISLTSLLHWDPVITDIRLEKPVLNLVRKTDGSYNVSDIMTASPEQSTPADNPDDESTPESKGTSIPGFILKNVGLTQGKILFEDQVTALSHSIEDLAIDLPLLSSQTENQDEAAVMEIGFLLNRAALDIHARITPFAREPAARIRIRTGEINAVPFLSYAKLPDRFKIESLGVNTEIETQYRKKENGDSLEIQGMVNLLDFNLVHPGGSSIAGFDRLSLEIRQADIPARRFNLGTVGLDAPRFTMIRDKEGGIDLQKLFSFPAEDNPPPASLPDSNGEKDPDGSNNEPLQMALQLDLLEVSNGVVDFTDHSGSRLFSTQISPLTVRLEKVAVSDTIDGAFFVSLETPDKEKLEAEGVFGDSFETLTGKARVTDLEIEKYRPYFDSHVNMDVNRIDVVKGKLSVATEFDIHRSADNTGGEIRITDTSCRSFSLTDRQSGRDLLALPLFHVRNSRVDLSERKIDIGSIETENGNIWIKRFKDGQLNWVKAFQSEPDNPPASRKVKTGGEPAESEPWQVELSTLDLAGFQIDFDDAAPTDPVAIHLSNLSVRANGLTSHGNTPADLSIAMDWNQKGKLAVRGKATPSASSADLGLHIEELDIRSIQPYFTDAVNVMVTSGDIHADGNLGLNFNKSTNDPMVRFTGQTSVTEFVCLDKSSAAEFFKAQSFFISGLDLSVFPVEVTAGQIALTDFYSEIMIDETGELNLRSVFQTGRDETGAPVSRSGPTGPVETTPPAKREQSGSVPDIRIDTVTLQGGEIQFSDYFTQPNFTAGMKSVAGSVTGLSSDESARANLILKGLHGQSSPLEIFGTVNPLAQNRFADLGITFNNIELIRFTPYAAKYLGYKIEKGKLVLDLEYRISGNRLESENRIRFDNFALGDRVESEDAVSLPIGLAVSLLKNKEGRINLDLPVKGELNDPDFSIAGILFKMIGNLILKAAASPFSIIGSLFSGGEDLEFLDFQPGEPGISGINAEKIDQLAEILETKPDLILEIQGLFNVEKESEALRYKGFMNLIKAEKLKQVAGSPESAKTLDEVIVTDDELPVYIDLAYSKALFPKPRDAAGNEKIIDAAEKQTLLMSHIPVDENQLRLLSMNRAENIKSHMISKSEVEKERIFILEPMEKETDDTGTSQVKFILK